MRAGLLKGRYTFPKPVESIEKYANPRADFDSDKIILPPSLDRYLHPDKEEGRKIQVITPYSDTAGGKNSSQNHSLSVCLNTEAEQNMGVSSTLKMPDLKQFLRRRFAAE